MEKPYTISLSSFALIFLLTLSRVSAIDAAGFTVDLIPKDSFLSPSLLSPEERIRNALQRSFNRAALFSNRFQLESGSTEVVADGGEFLMQFSIGTPPLKTFAIVDTGSDLTWIRCKPCNDCYKQKPPLFDPTCSSSYKNVSCESDTCSAVSSAVCSGTQSTCRYTIRYGDKSTTAGDVSTDTLLIGGSSVPNFLFGCGHLERGDFTSGTAGIVGLGSGKESLINQLDSSIQGKFSYCLAPSGSSKLKFGDIAAVSGAEVVSTPIIPNFPDTFYHLTLEGITVGSERLDYVPSRAAEGNIIIDSGTTLTFLPTELYEKVEAELRRQVRLREITDASNNGLKVCYEVREGSEATLPGMVAHFKGADVKLSNVNCFVRIDSNSICLAFMPSDFPIYGNIAQTNFLVGYDLSKNTVSFNPTDCTEA